jgi:hypothetical protein
VPEDGDVQIVLNSFKEYTALCYFNLEEFRNSAWYKLEENSPTYNSLSSQEKNIVQSNYIKYNESRFYYIADNTINILENSQGNLNWVSEELKRLNNESPKPSIRDGGVIGNHGKFSTREKNNSLVVKNM